MTSGYDEIMAPVLAGMCSYESLKDGTLDLGDIALMNDALAVSSENRRRAREHHEGKGS